MRACISTITAIAVTACDSSPMSPFCNLLALLFCQVPMVLLPSSLLLYQQLLPLTKSSIVLGALRCHLLTELLLLLRCHVQNAQLLLTIFLG